MCSLRRSTAVSVSEAAGRSLRACCSWRAVTGSGAVAMAASPMTTTPVQLGGQRYDRGDTATLMAGVNLAAAPARLSHSSRARAISAGEGMTQSCLMASAPGGRQAGTREPAVLGRRCHRPPPPTHYGVEAARARGHPIDAELLARLRERYDDAVVFGITHNRHRAWRDGNHPHYTPTCAP